MVLDVVWSRLCMRRGCGRTSAEGRYIFVNLDYPVGLKQSDNADCSFGKADDAMD